jgi:hypothetical protein
MQNLHHDDNLSHSSFCKDFHSDGWELKFCTTLRKCLQLLDSVKVPCPNRLLTAGSGVFLYELLLKGVSERQPTDIDWILLEDSALPKKLCMQASRFFDKVVRHEKSREHHGFVFTTPIVEAESESDFPCDFISSAMVTKFPEDNQFLPGVVYRFPIDNYRLFELGRNFIMPFVGTVKIAPPAFIAFYKITMMRNSLGKQDLRDVVLLRNLGLLNRFDNKTNEVFDILCNGYPGLKNQILKEIHNL